MINREEMYNKLLIFAESVANSRSGRLHDFYGKMVQEAREVVRAAGGRLRNRGRYMEGSATPKPFEVYKDGKWIFPVYDAKNDRWFFA